jgi:3-oxoacyl-[acyl-carrier-protein] synthase-3
MQETKAVITGVGSFLPDYRLTNDEMARLVETSDEWIMTRIGIKERRIMRDRDKASAYMGAKAIEKIFKKTNTTPEEIDLVICATVTPDMVFPATANIISDMLSKRNL